MAIFFRVRRVTEALDYITVWHSQVVCKLSVPQLGACLHQVIFLDLGSLLEVQMLEEGLHLLEETAVHEDCTDAAQEFIKVNIFFFSLVQQGKDPSQNLGWVFKTEHFRDFNEVESLDARRTVVFLKQCISMENVVLERFHIDAVQRYQSIRPHDVDLRGHNTIGAWHISSKATEIGWCLLQVSEVLSQELDRVLRPVLEKERYGLFEVGSDVLSFQVVLRRHILLRGRIIS